MRAKNFINLKTYSSGVTVLIVLYGFILKFLNGVLARADRIECLSEVCKTSDLSTSSLSTSSVLLTDGPKTLLCSC